MKRPSRDPSSYSRRRISSTSPPAVTQRLTSSASPPRPEVRPSQCAARDRFGDAGVVGLALARTEGDSCVIDSFLLSCRVIGRGIETALLAHLAEHAREAGAKRLIGEFVPSRKNAPCADFYPEHGFVRRSSPEEPDTASTCYEYDLTTATPISPAWITLEGTESHELSGSALLSS